MPIERSKAPWIFTPSLSEEASAALMQILGYMQRYYLMGHDCPSYSYVWTYMREIHKTLKVNDASLERVCEYFNEMNFSIEQSFRYLNGRLTSSRQKKYCKDIINTMALHISNQAYDDVITRMLNNFLDKEVEMYLR